MYKTASPRVHDPRSQTHMPHDSRHTHTLCWTTGPPSLGTTGSLSCHLLWMKKPRARSKNYCKNYCNLTFRCTRLGICNVKIICSNLYTQSAFRTRTLSNYSKMFGCKALLLVLAIFQIANAFTASRSSIRGTKFSLMMAQKEAFQLVLLRHGESSWNKENKFTGWWVHSYLNCVG